MSVEIQISNISNDKSTLSVFINGRPTYWEAHSIYVDVMDPATGKTAVRKDIKTQSLLRHLLNKYCEVNDKTPLEEGFKQLKKRFGNEYNIIMTAVELTENIAQKMANQEFSKTIKDNFSL